MKAIVITKYGSPDVLQLKELEKPVPRDNEVLISVAAGTVTPADCTFRKGEPFMIKLIYGLVRPKFSVLGVEFAGEIEAVGKDVKLFKKGDQVFGTSPNSFGANAEYMCLLEAKPLVIKPANMSYEEAVGVCDGATTALTFLRDVAKIRPEQTVLINGASGAVGAYAVQLAKYFGAQVTGICSTRNIDMVKALGADQVIDYSKTDFTKSGQTFDVIFDAVGKSSFSKCKDSLTPKGLYLSTVPSPAMLLQMLWTSKFGSKKALFTAAGLQQNKDNLLFLKELIEAGKLKAVIDKCYPLEQVVEAHQYVEKGHKKGNVILTLAPNNPT